jgi:DNA-binding HxlR family transcriptional regulator
MNQRTNFENTACSIARTLNIIGEWWTLLILRDIFYEVTRFNLLREHLGISRKILTNRLNTLTANEIIKRRKYQDNPPRFDYTLTEKGRELFPVIISLMHWGNKWIYNNEDIPIQLFDDKGKEISPVLINKNSGEPIIYGKTHANLGSPSHKTEWDKLNQAVNECRSNKTA